uniref:Borealin n=1 Tax=Ditylenchus dipsaci TaxID=166011 RepID=A0A915CVL7_9BILA
MARSKKPIDPQKEAEMRELLAKFKQGFAAAIVELETAKRNFSTAYVDAMLHQLEESIPKHVLSMKALDFLRNMEEPNPQEIQKTPNQKQPFTSIMTATGVKINIPAIIKPRIGDGSVLQSRQPESDEVLFSVRGTPVFDSNNGPDGDGSIICAKERCSNNLPNSQKRKCRQLLRESLTN